MPASTLEQLVGELLDDDFRVIQVLRNEPERALLRASETIASETTDTGSPREIVVVLDLSGNPDDHFKRFLEAKFLRHSHLAPCSRVGWLEIDGIRHPWMATEIPESILGDVLHHDTPLDASDLASIVRQISSGIAYLHSENLAYCALRPETIWRVNGLWVLADFSQLRVLGSPPVASGDISPYALEVLPPEACQSQVSAEWDTWSLGPLVARALEQLPDTSQKWKKRNGSPLPNPAPGEMLLREIAASRPQDRPALDHIVTALTALSVTAASVESPAVVLRPEHPAESSHEQPRLRGRNEILRTPPVHEPERTIPWTRVAQAALVIAVAFLTALLVGRSMTHEGNRAGNATPSLTKTAAAPPNDVSVSRQVPPALPQEDPATANDNLPSPAIRTEVVSALNSWAAATRARNAEALVDCYAPVVDTYFSRHHMSAYELTREKQKSLAEIGPIRSFSISDLHYDRVAPNSVVVTFVKSWAFGGAKPFSGAAREQMILRPFSDRWKISSERELKVF